MNDTSCFELNGFRFNVDENVIEKNGVSVRLTNKVSDVLALLINADGAVVTRDSLLEQVWPKRFGADESLSRTISDLRKKLESLESGLGSSVETIPKRGYKFNRIAVKPTQEEVSDPQPQRSNASIINILITSTLIITIAIVTFFIYRTKHDNQLALNGVAVLTFKDLSGENKLKGLPEGITEEVLNILATHTDMRIISRTSSHYFSDKLLPVPEIAKELGVRFIVEGTIQHHENIVKVSTRIVDGLDGQQIATASFTFNGQDILNIQRDVAKSIAQSTASLSLEDLPHKRRNSVEFKTELRFLSLKASLLNLAPENLQQLQKDVQQLVDKRPSFDDAQFLLSIILSIRANWVQIEEDTAFEMSRAILEGKEEAYKFNGLYWFAKALMVSPRATTPRSGNSKLALEYFEKAFELEPQNSLILKWYILVLQMTGNDSKARLIAESKLETDPFNATLLDGLAMYYYAQGNYERSEKFARRLSAVENDQPQGPNRLAYIHIIKNDLLEADIQAQECLERSIRYMNCWVHKAEIHESAGQEKLLKSIYQVMKKLAPPVIKTLTLHELNRGVSEGKNSRIKAYLTTITEEDFKIGFFPQAYLVAVSEIKNGHLEPYIDLALSRVSSGQSALFRHLLFPDDISSEKTLLQLIDKAENNVTQSRYNAYFLAQLYAQVGDYEAALGVLSSLVSNRMVPSSFQRFYQIENDPFFRQMKEIPKFNILLNQHVANKKALAIAISQNNETQKVIDKAMSI